MYLSDGCAAVDRHLEQEVRRDHIFYIILSDQEDHRYDFEAQNSLNYFIHINKILLPVRG